MSLQKRSRASKRRKNRWALASLALLVMVAAVVWQQGVSESGPYSAYADPEKPSLVFLYTSEAHLMPDGSKMY